MKNTDTDTSSTSEVYTFVPWFFNYHLVVFFPTLSTSCSCVRVCVQHSHSLLAGFIFSLRFQLCVHYLESDLVLYCKPPFSVLCCTYFYCLYSIAVQCIVLGEQKLF